MEEVETETVEFLSVVHETPKGILLQFKSGDAWLPKAHITIEENVVTFPTWVTLQYTKHVDELDEDEAF